MGFRTEEYTRVFTYPLRAILSTNRLIPFGPLLWWNDRIDGRT